MVKPKYERIVFNGIPLAVNIEYGLLQSCPIPMDMLTLPSVFDAKSDGDHGIIARILTDESTDENAALFMHLMWTSDHGAEFGVRDIIADPSDDGYGGVYDACIYYEIPSSKWAPSRCTIIDVICLENITGTSEAGSQAIWMFLRSALQYIIEHTSE